ncbi:MAG: T9SS type A sorting domain-containing protein [Bacteroidales bacterium]|nr:T9SS type A sorting domain-containing protein [Bacteroidales bacterium]
MQVFLLVLLICPPVIAGWEPFSPEGIHANRITFYVDNQNNWAVAGSHGLHLYNLNTQEWTFNSSILPVVDASWLDGDDILVLFNGGTMEDGVHFLFMETGTYYALQYLDTPHFIKHLPDAGRFYVGHWHGLKYSDNVEDWYDIDFFNNMNIVDMEIFGDHYVVSRIDNLYEVYYSDDAGESWTISSNAPMISDLEFDNNGKLYGIFPDESWSSGLWSSNDFGATWNEEFWATGINCVGTDPMENVFVGFSDEAFPPHEGIARWDSLNQSLYYLNEGLPNLNINQITYNPGMSAIALFCCTDTGVYINYNYVGMNEPPDLSSAPLKIWPNPAQDKLNIRHGLEGNLSISIYSAEGKMVDNFSSSDLSKDLYYDCSGLHKGIYFLVIDNGNEKQSMKWIKR